MGQLPLHHGAGPRNCSRVGLREANDLQAIGERSQRIPQLMSEHRQKLVLLAVRSSQRLLDPLPL